MIDDRLEGVRIANCEIGENLPVDHDLCLFYSVHELRICESMFAHAGVDALYPERAKIAFPRAPIAIGVLEIFFDALDRRAEGVF